MVWIGGSVNTGLGNAVYPTSSLILWHLLTIITIGLEAGSSSSPIHTPHPSLHSQTRIHEALRLPRRLPHGLRLSRSRISLAPRLPHFVPRASYPACLLQPLFLDFHSPRLTRALHLIRRQRTEPPIVLVVVNRLNRESILTPYLAEY